MRFCVYCRKEKPRKGFINKGINSEPPRWQCADCQSLRLRPQQELEDLAHQQRKERK